MTALKEKFGENYADNLYKISLIGKVDENLTINCAEIQAQLGEIVFFVKLRNNTEIAIDLPLLAKENSLRGKFVKIMLQRCEEQPETAEQIMRSLYLGLKAFNAEVKFSENR